MCFQAIIETVGIDFVLAGFAQNEAWIQVKF